ncbi:MAG: 3'(2'),5'-bisphosphate nucleotidase CysQ [Litoreibacter sp.]|nr:3'(2'),5'-bisphosphate nucleotidase CysQ [Litoreibacter sp.]
MPATDDLTLLSDAALAAAKIGKRYFQSDPEVWDKSGGQGPVTQADLEIDTMLRQELSAARPDYGWLSEETEDDSARQEAERVFIVDPIDGTRAFIAGERSWSHSLAIAERGEVIAAAVYVPMMDRLYTASNSDVSRLNGTPIESSKRLQIEDATVLAAKSNMKPEHWLHGAPPLKRHFRPSLAYRLSLAAQGRFDAMLTLRPCWEWDIAAGELLVRKAGGTATDMTGKPLRFNNAMPQTLGCVAAGAGLHPQILGRLAPPR